MIEIYSESTLLQFIKKVMSAGLRETLEGEFTLSFSVMAKSALALKTRQIAKLNNQYFEIVQISKSIQGSLPVCSVLCEHVSYLLNHEMYKITEFDFTGEPATGLSQLLAGTPFSAGVVDFAESITMKINQNVTRRAALIQYIAILGGEIEYDGYNINIRQHRGSAEYISVMGSKNVTDIAVSQDSRENTSSYAISFLKLMDLAVGDNVHIVFHPLGIDVKTRIISLEYNPFYRYNIRVEVGSYKPSISNTFYKIENTINTVDYAFEGGKLNSATLKGLSIVNENTDVTTFEITEEGDTFVNGSVTIGPNTDFDPGYDPSTKMEQVTLGDMAYEDAVEKSMLGTTVIEGGYLKTGFVDASRIDTGTLNANQVNIEAKDESNNTIIKLGKIVPAEGATPARYGLRINGENGELMLDEYGIDPRFIKAFKNMIWNSSFERYDPTTKVPQFWTGGEVTSTSSFDNTNSMKLDIAVMSEQSLSDGSYNPRPDPSWWDNRQTRISFFKKGGDVQVQVFSESDYAPYELTTEDSTTQFFYNTGYSSNWEEGRYTFSFNPTKPGRIWIRFSNIGGSAAYIDAVQMEPDFNGKYPSFYTNGPYSVSADEIPLSDTWIEYINMPYAESLSVQFNQRYSLPPTVTANILRNINAANTGAAFGNHNICPNIDLIIEDVGGYLFYTGAYITFGGSPPTSITNGYISVCVVGRV